MDILFSTIASALLGFALAFAGRRLVDRLRAWVNDADAIEEEAVESLLSHVREDPFAGRAYARPTEQDKKKFLGSSA